MTRFSYIYKSLVGVPMIRMFIDCVGYLCGVLDCICVFCFHPLMFNFFFNLILFVLSRIFSDTFAIFFVHFSFVSFVLQYLLQNLKKSVNNKA